MPNATSCSHWRLYVILDPAAAKDRDLAWIAKRAIEGGADVLQLRNKHASVKELTAQAESLLSVTRRAKVPLLINDRVDVAAAVGADGVHIGQDDVAVSVAREILGPRAIVGKSSHSLAQAVRAAGEGTDYIAVGPLYATPTKPDYPEVGLPLIRQVRAKVGKPIVCIGGVSLETLPDVLAAGATCVAVVRAVAGAEDPASAARNLKRLLSEFPRKTS